MAGSVNKVILIGHLGRDPEVRRMGNGNPVVSFSLATSESWRDKASGERKDRTEWHNIVVFNEQLCKVAEQYTKKGSKVYVEGILRTREYTDKDGVKRKTTEILLENFRGELTLLDKVGSDRAPPVDQNSYPGTTSTRQGAAPAQRTADAIDDDIPF